MFPMNAVKQISPDSHNLMRIATLDVSSGDISQYGSIRKTILWAVFEMSVFPSPVFNCDISVYRNSKCHGLAVSDTHRYTTKTASRQGKSTSKTRRGIAFVGGLKKKEKKSYKTEHICRSTRELSGDL